MFRECVLVARFDSPGAAARLLAELTPGYHAGEPYSEGWKALFRSAAVDTPRLDVGVAPAELGVLGASLLARTCPASSDGFPELRALAAQRGARVLPGGLHEAGAAVLLFAIQALSPADAASVVGRAPAGETLLVTHGDVAIGVLPIEGGVMSCGPALHEMAGVRPLAVQLYAGEVTVIDLLERAHRLDTSLDAQTRLVVDVSGPDGGERARALAGELGGTAVAAAAHVIAEAEGAELRRMEVVARRTVAPTAVLVGRQLAVDVVLRPSDATIRAEQRVDPAAITARLTELASAAGATMEPRASRSERSADAVRARLHTRDPVAALDAVSRLAREEQHVLEVQLEEVDPLDVAIRGRVAEVRARRPRASRPS